MAREEREIDRRVARIVRKVRKRWGKALELKLTVKQEEKLSDKIRDADKKKAAGRGGGGRGNGGKKRGRTERYVSNRAIASKQDAANQRPGRSNFRRSDLQPAVDSLLRNQPPMQVVVNGKASESDMQLAKRVARETQYKIRKKARR